MVIINVPIVSNACISEKSYIRIKKGIITQIGPMSNYSKNSDSGDVLDGEGLYACAGYVDMHSHGGYGFDTMDGTTEALDKISEFHLDNGITSFMATTLTASFRSIQKAIDIVGKHKTQHARVIGVHLEGPFLSRQNRGAQPEEYLAVPDEEARQFILKNSDVIRLITISPDVDGIDKLIRECVKRGIVVSGGHDWAIDTEIDEAINSGMTNVTHIYCCSSGITRRDTAQKRIGLTQIGLLDDRLWVEVIADGCHVPDRLFDLIYKCKGYKKICLVSDSLRAAGMPKGYYMLGGKDDGVEIEVAGDVALIKGTNRYAGSITSVSKMVERLVARAGVPLEEAVYMATQSPASSLRLSDRGLIECGKLADINLIDKAGRVKVTILDGKIVRNKIKN